MLKAKFFMGQPVSFKKGIVVYPPLVNDFVSNDKAFYYTSLLTTSQEELIDQIKEMEKKNKIKIFEDDEYPTPFEYLLSRYYQNPLFQKELEKAFEFLIRDKVTILPEKKMVMVNKIQEELLTSSQNPSESLDNLFQYVIQGDDEYFSFQNLVRESLGKKPIEDLSKIKDPRLRRMKKLALKRDRIKEKQESKGESISFDWALTTICTMGIGITPFNIGDLTYSAFNKLQTSYRTKENYDTSVRALTSGFGSSTQKSPRHWTLNPED